MFGALVTSILIKFFAYLSADSKWNLAMYYRIRTNPGEVLPEKAEKYIPPAKTIIPLIVFTLISVGFLYEMARVGDPEAVQNAIESIPVLEFVLAAVSILGEDGGVSYGRMACAGLNGIISLTIANIVLTHLVSGKNTKVRQYLSCVGYSAFVILLSMFVGRMLGSIGISRIINGMERKKFISLSRI